MSTSSPPKPSPLSESDWRARLSPQQFHVLREKGTERAFTGELWDHHASGRYLCAGCGGLLFDSEAKFDSGCGWPSFSAAAKTPEVNIDELVDLSHGMRRVEVTCSGCGGHLGHVFPDGPRPTGIRYCINSASLTFEPSAPGSPPEAVGPKRG